MINVAVAGAAGRMGKSIMAAAMNRPQEIVIAGALEMPGHPLLGKTVAEALGLPSINVEITSDLKQALAKADVLIDFTAPEASLNHLSACVEFKKASVIGTTGLNSAQQIKLDEFSRKTPVVFAPNMSVGVNLMFKIAALMAKVLGPDFALEVTEAHHDQKKDAPSGTALKLLAELAQARELDMDKILRHGRLGLVGPRTRDEIGVSVIRGGDIVGDHTVYFIGQGERLELTHRAHSRDTFAQGAIRAALWVAGKKPGLYSMQDVLDIKEL